MAVVVRGGYCGASSLRRGYRRHPGAAGVWGLSVQYAPGRSIEDLIRAGRLYSYPVVSYADEADLAAAVAPLGFRIRLI